MDRFQDQFCGVQSKAYASFFAVSYVRWEYIFLYSFGNRSVAVVNLQDRISSLIFC